MRTTSPALLALSIGAFGIGVTEFAPMGMLPWIASDLGVSIPVAGLLVSAYAMGVLIGAPLMTLATNRMPRRTLLIGLMGIFTLGNLLSAMAHDYSLLLVARLITSLNHGAFFGVGSVVAVSVVAPDKRAGAVATMFTGLTIATIGGVPLATWVGDVLGWRTAFMGIAALGVVAMAALRLSLPNVPSPANVSVKGELRVLASREVLGALALTVVGSSAWFTVFTYIAPILREATHASTGFITLMLMLFGIGLTIGNIWSGKASDRSRDGTLIASLAGLAITMVVFSVAMRWQWSAAIVILLWGIASFAIVAPLQMRVMEAAAHAPNLASAMNIGAFNLGNAIGAALGGAVINAGLSYPAVSLAGASAAALALMGVLLFRSELPGACARP